MGSKAAFRDPSIDLDVSSKALKDEGFCEVASALVEALSYNGIQGRCTRLEELCLSENELCLQSLQILTPIIRLACHDLRDLDLAGNRIQISTEEDVAIWENFLGALEESSTLRRIDLSGNPLGPRGFETLLRVYARERPVDLLQQSELQPDESYSLSADEDLSPTTRTLVSEPDKDGHVLDNNLSDEKRAGSRFSLLLFAVFLGELT